jgi:hypothetical protein
VISCFARPDWYSNPWHYIPVEITPASGLHHNGTQNVVSSESAPNPALSTLAVEEDYRRNIVTAAQTKDRIRSGGSAAGIKARLPEVLAEDNLTARQANRRRQKTQAH